MKAERLEAVRRAAPSVRQELDKAQSSRAINRMDASIRASTNPQLKVSFLRSNQQQVMDKLQDVMTDFAQAREVSLGFARSMAQDNASTTKVLASLISGPGSNNQEWTKILGNFIDTYV